MREGQRKRQFTLLMREAAWGDEDGLICGRLKTAVYAHPQHPSALILFGRFEKQDVAAVIGNNDFTLQQVVGYDNPDLPFRPPAF